ncbi:YqaA family protein [Mesorhizobium loti]|uniref:YqaA family protein n=1 Tax=Rhizobium loti TaxID=381 RepID=UPI0032AF2F4D
MALHGALFLSAFLAATVLPISSEAVLAGLVVSGRGDPALLLAVATVGNTLGSVVNWILGRGIDTLRNRRWFPATPDRYATAFPPTNRIGGKSTCANWSSLLGGSVQGRTGIGLI